MKMYLCATDLFQIMSSFTPVARPYSATHSS